MDAPFGRQANNIDVQPELAGKGMNERGLPAID